MRIASLISAPFLATLLLATSSTAFSQEEDTPSLARSTLPYGMQIMGSSAMQAAPQMGSASSGGGYAGGGSASSGGNTNPGSASGGSQSASSRGSSVQIKGTTAINAVQSSSTSVAAGIGNASKNETGRIGGE